MTRKKPIIGLVGGIGAGKSTAAGILRDLGVEVIDADAIVHQELATAAVVEMIGQWWPGTVVNGQVDRKTLAKQVFGDPRLLGRLEGLLWPRVLAAVERQLSIATARNAGCALAIDAPMLLEAGLDAVCDCVVFLDADLATRLARVRPRGWDEQELARREATQMPIATKRSRADHVVTSDDQLHKRLTELLESLLHDGSDGSIGKDDVP